METKKTAVAVGLVVALAAVVGYAYIAGLGPLEENPAAGLEEPPETESTYSFGEVPETGSEADGSVDSQTDSDIDTQGNTETDDADAEVGAEPDGQAGDTGTDTEASVEVNAADGGTDSQAGDETEDGTEDETDEEGVRGEEDEEEDNENSRDEEVDGGDDNDGGDNDGVDRDKVGTDGADRGAVDTLDAEPERSGPPFVPELENMEECGETCREATVALQNNMNADAENVVVYVRLHAGDSTDSDDVVWAENRNIGTLAPGEVYRETETVDLTPQQANKVREKGGVVTAKATIESEQATATFVERDNVE